MAKTQRELNQQHYRLDPSKHKERCRLWREQNPEAYKAQVEKEAAKLKTLRNKDAEYRKKINALNREAYHKNKHINRARGIWASAKRRAKESGIPFNIEVSDIVVPELCPVLGVPLILSDKVSAYNSASLDKIDPALGYIKGNVQIISKRANVMKTDASKDELLLFAAWVYRTFG